MSEKALIQNQFQELCSHLLQLQIQERTTIIPLTEKTSVMHIPSKPVLWSLNLFSGIIN